MLTNDVKRKLKAGKPVVGVWLALGDAIVAESLAAQGWDWLTVDTEHNPIDLLTMTGMFQAIGRYPVAPLARIPEVSELGIKRILDAGAWGFVAPNVKTREGGTHPQVAPTSLQGHSSAPSTSATRTPSSIHG